MWIGTSGGLSHMKDPNAVPSGPPSPPVFSQVTFGASSIANGGQVLWSASPLEISMASLSFRDERHLRIRYRLLGLETEWVETGENSLRYPRLAPGTYQFQAAAVDASSGAASPVDEFSFTITPRWWQGWWIEPGIGLDDAGRYNARVALARPCAGNAEAATGARRSSSGPRTWSAKRLNCSAPANRCATMQSTMA